MKRKAAVDAAVFNPSKKSRIEDLDALHVAPGSEDTDYEPEVEDAFEQESQSANTLASTQPTNTNTPLTPLSPPRRKFPSELKTIKCTYPGCDKSYNRPARLAAHLRSHTNDRPYKCTYPDCDKAYIEEKHLKQHIKGSHTAERQYTCTEEGCGKSFLTATRLRRHQAVHEGQERFRCRDFPPCTQTFRKHQTLQRHIRTDHLHVAAYPCTYKDPATGAACGAGFDTAATLKRHEEREHGELRFWCDECIRHLDEHGNPKQTGFPTAWLLQNHMKQVHANCMFCGLSCNGRAELEEHIEEQHSQQSLEERKNIACTWDGCDKTFTKKSNLYAHIRAAHEGVRFVCGEVDLRSTEDLATWPQAQGCGEGFATKASLENHVRYVHLKHERPPQATTSTAASPSSDHQQGGLTLLQELTGIGNKSRRTVPCPIPGCNQKFFHASEREAHVQSQHYNHSHGMNHHVEPQALLPDLGAAGGPMLSGAGMSAAGGGGYGGDGGARPHGSGSSRVEVLYPRLWEIHPDQAYWDDLDAVRSSQQQQAAPEDQFPQDEVVLRELLALDSLIDPALE